jgi:hypothetical protein
VASRRVEQWIEADEVRGGYAPRPSQLNPVLCGATKPFAAIGGTANDDEHSRTGDTHPRVDG